MIPFDSFVMVDWSGGNDTGARPRKDAIWAGGVFAHQEIEPVYLRNRTLAFDWLAQLIAAEISGPRRVLIGFDFPFGYPKGFVRQVTGKDDPFAIWGYLADALQDTPSGNNRFQLAGQINARFPGVGPFWFNATQSDIPHLPRKGRERHGHGLPERRQAESRAKGTFTCWQMGGAGAVGGQVMTGLAVLERLRRRFPDRIGTWPFDLEDQQVAFVEIWPSFLAAKVRDAKDEIKDRAQVRLMARALSRLPNDVLHDMLDVDAPEEGWIFGIGYEDVLERALC